MRPTAGGTHGRRRAFESDRARDATLQAHGHRVVRFTWRQVIHETLLVTVRIAQILSLCDPTHSALDAYHTDDMMRAT